MTRVAPLVLVTLASLIAAAPAVSALSLGIGLGDGADHGLVSLQLAAPELAPIAPLVPRALAHVEARDLATPLGELSVGTGSASADPFGDATTAPKPALEASSTAAPAARVSPVLVTDSSAPAAALALVTLVGFALYSRIAKSDVLHHEVRERVFRLIETAPGLGMQDISRQADVGWGATVYHLDRLERAGLVASERLGMSRRFYAVARVAPAERPQRALLFGGTGRFAHAVLAKPGAQQSELARELGLTPGAVAKQVAALEAAGLVRRERDGRAAHCYPTETLRQLAGETVATTGGSAAA
ncbi:MAG: winged helix-turn-helix transcriptional regulator [Thermoplasmatota archaeon]